MSETTNPCPVARLAAETSRLDLAHTRASEGGENQAAWHLFEHMMAIEEMATHERARSGEGALFHALVLANDLERAEDLRDGPERDAAFRRLHRLASSLAVYVERSADPSVAADLRARLSVSGGEDVLAQLAALREAA